MGFIDDKKEIVESVALYQTLGDLPKTKSVSSLRSVNSKSKNLIPFLMDILSLTCKDDSRVSTPQPIPPVDNNPTATQITQVLPSKCEAKKILLDILIEFFPKLIEIIKKAIIKAIKAGLACKTNFKLPGAPPTYFGQLPTPGQIPGVDAVKIKVPIKSVDFNGMTKVNPTSSVGSTLYGKNPNKDFNWFLNNTIQSNGTTSNWKGIMNLRKTPNQEELEISMDSNYAHNNGNGRSFDNFLGDYVNSLDLISKENLVAKLGDRLTGSITSRLNPPPSLDKLIAQEKINRVLDKIIDGSADKKEYKLEDNYFNFNDDELLEIEDVCNQKINGSINLDLGCGFLPVNLNVDTFLPKFNEIRNNPKSNLVLQNIIDSINDDLTKNIPAESSSTVKNTLNTEFIKEIPKVLTEIVLEPKIVVLYQVASKLVNGPLPNAGQPNVSTPTITTPTVTVNPTITAENSFDFVKSTKVFFEIVARESLAALLEIVYKKVKEVVIVLIAKQIISIVKEQIKLRVLAIKSSVSSKVNDATNKVSDNVKNNFS